MIISNNKTHVSSKSPFGTDVIDDSLETIEQLYEYNHWVFNTIRPYLGDDVLEVGSGTGNITQFLAMYSKRVVGLEPVDHFASRFNERFEHMSHVSSKVGYLHELSEPTESRNAFDSVVSCNVLEHIEDHVGAVKQMADQLRPGGKVILFVPAGPFALGKLDRELGHYRRYTKRSIKNTIEQAGLTWETGKYNNAIGLLGWFVNSVLLRRTTVPTKQAKLVDKLTPLLSAIERYLPIPFGQSVMGVGRKPMTQAQSNSE
jgi:2-polyprenyl-3-methyl-5-hydroxy-6-metoxy-1,4-benzoquinol methylase